MEKERAEDKLHQFLLGIDEYVCGTVKSSLLSRDPLPNLDEAYNVLTQDEVSKKAVVDTHNDGVSFTVQIMTKPAGDKSIVCASCGRIGHSAENYFRTIGYPPMAWRSSTEQRTFFGIEQTKRTSFGT